MRRLRGFKLGHRFVRIFKWMIRPRRVKPGKRHYPNRDSSPVSRICTLARCLRRGAKRLCSKNPVPGTVTGPGPVEIRLGKEATAAVVPKGHLAVYIGESGGHTRRVVMPVIYFNHPLFGELLEQAERVYGFDQPGRITIPCRVSDFEKVQTRIAAWDHCRRKRSYKIL